MEPEALAQGLLISDAKFAARLAFGVRNSPRNGETNWIVLQVSDGAGIVDGPAALPSAELPEDDLEVVLGIAATADVWRGAESDSGFLSAVGNQKFFVTGEAPFFVRHISPILEIWRHLREQ